MLPQIPGNNPILKLKFWKLKTSIVLFKPDFANGILKTFCDRRHFYTEWGNEVHIHSFFNSSGRKNVTHHLQEGLTLRQNKIILRNINIADFYYPFNSLCSVSKILFRRLFCFATISL